MTISRRPATPNLASKVQYKYCIIYDVIGEVTNIYKEFTSLRDAEKFMDNEWIRIQGRNYQKANRPSRHLITFYDGLDWTELFIEKLKIEYEPYYAEYDNINAYISIDSKPKKYRNFIINKPVQWIERKKTEWDSKGIEVSIFEERAYSNLLYTIVGRKHGERLFIIEIYKPPYSHKKPY